MYINEPVRIFNRGCKISSITKGYFFVMNIFFQVNFNFEKYYDSPVTMFGTLIDTIQMYLLLLLKEDFACLPPMIRHVLVCVAIGT